MKKSENTNLTDKQALAIIDDLRQQLLKVQNGHSGKFFFYKNTHLKIELFKENGKEIFRADIAFEFFAVKFLTAFYSDFFTSKQILNIIKTALKSYISKA